jgi:hypothetical protein
LVSHDGHEHACQRRIFHSSDNILLLFPKQKLQKHLITLLRSKDFTFFSTSPAEYTVKKLSPLVRMINSFFRKDQFGNPFLFFSSSPSQSSNYRFHGNYYYNSSISFTHLPVYQFLHKDAISFKMNHLATITCIYLLDVSLY